MATEADGGAWAPSLRAALVHRHNPASPGSFDALPLLKPDDFARWSPLAQKGLAFRSKGSIGVVVRRCVVSVRDPTAPFGFARSGARPGEGLGSFGLPG